MTINSFLIKKKKKGRRGLNLNLALGSWQLKANTVDLCSRTVMSNSSPKENETHLVDFASQCTSSLAVYCAITNIFGLGIRKLLFLIVVPT